MTRHRKRETLARKLTRHRRSLALVLIPGSLAVLLALALVTMPNAADTTPVPESNEPRVAATVAAPDVPTAPICDNRQILDGPTDPPAGAVRVTTEEDLGRLTLEHGEGTTFWLEPGVHHFADDEFGQVIPKPGNTYVGAPGAIVDGRHLNRYAFTGDATGVTISHLTIQNFGAPGTNNNSGVVNHDSAAGWSIVGNTIAGNAGAGVMIGSDNLIVENCIRNNGQYGFNAFHPDAVRDVVVERNEIAGNNVDDWEVVKPGCGCSGGGKFWEVSGAVIRENWIHDNRGPGLWVDTNNAGFLIEGNYIADNDAEGVIYETSYNALIRSNAFIRNGLVKGPTNPSFPTSAMYVSESGSDTRVPTDYGEKFEIANNVFVNNWAGVILWENSDRFAGSPANTSTDSGTMVNSVVTADTCNAANIDADPYLDDCRWKTQNVLVHDNTFVISPDEIGTACTTQSGCGYNGIFANWGTFPSWSPYHGDTVQEAITFDQENRFFANTYTGPWRFLIYGQGNTVDWSRWQSAPYWQDADSMIRVNAPNGS